MKKKPTPLDIYFVVTNQLADYFAKKYFSSSLSEMWWVADDVGGVLFINDYFFNMTQIVDFIRYGYTRKEMFEYYNYSTTTPTPGKIIINIKTWKKLNK